MPFFAPQSKCIFDDVLSAYPIIVRPPPMGDIRFHSTGISRPRGISYLIVLGVNVVEDTCRPPTTPNIRAIFPDFTLILSCAQAVSELQPELIVYSEGGSSRSFSLYGLTFFNFSLGLFLRPRWKVFIPRGDFRFFFSPLRREDPCKDRLTNLGSRTLKNNVLLSMKF